MFAYRIINHLNGKIWPLTTDNDNRSGRRPGRLGAQGLGSHGHDCHQSHIHHRKLRIANIMESSELSSNHDQHDQPSWSNKLVTTGFWIILWPKGFNWIDMTLNCYHLPIQLHFPGRRVIARATAGMAVAGPLGNKDEAIRWCFRNWDDPSFVEPGVSASQLIWSQKIASHPHDSLVEPSFDHQHWPAIANQCLFWPLQQFF